MRAPAIWLSIGALAVIGAGCSSAPTHGESTATGRQLHARLDSRQVVSPTPGQDGPNHGLAHAQGTFTGQLATKSEKLSWHLTYAGLGKPEVVIADIHYGKAGQFGALLVRLCAPCRTTHPSGTVVVSASGGAALVSGTSWVTVLTNSYPNGAIRGQIAAGPARG